MTHQSLNIALPSIHRIQKQEHKVMHHRQSYKQQQQQQQQPLHFKLSRSHARTTSVPSVLPSQQHSQKDRMHILLDAIDLDQQMRQFFKTEVIKSKNRTSSAFVPPSIMMARRRSKSAPGAPPSYHQQRAFNSRWIAPNCNNRTVTCASQAQEVAQLIVKQHFESVKKR
ncbi:hypothetical protein FB192DRAFT_1370391 [Mucor lusitanicus]|uniref:Uncharacterized protein n=2 Tax=Mucor circinelloides f. lusitanicus TaxID=29924 RepID=A0A168PUR8_MUCCL|nr:hypothetical protein FB192DRAFT_1370391 [Mucor lusitanicus]OAD08264.1 hypothetical protein MUCCIDRAFT_90111 [Mucor lusitanicus CBS 277.49]